MEKGHLEASPLHVATTEKESEVEGSENGGEDSYQQRLSWWYLMDLTEVAVRAWAAWLDGMEAGASVLVAVSQSLIR